jgi:hypothetical protein
MKSPTSPRGQTLLRICVFAISVALERRSIARGSHKGVQRVDARTGAAPSLRQTIIVLGARDATRWLLDRAIPRPGVAPALIRREMAQEIERVRLEHPNDQRARQEAIMRVSQRRQGVQVGCLPLLIRAGAAIAVDRCPVPFLEERRALVDLLAGTKLVRNGPSGWTRLRRHR